MDNPELNISLKKLAQKLALHCVRNTVIEDYHSRGSMSDTEMKVFNKQVVNNLYTFLQLMHNPIYHAELKTLFSENRIFHMPNAWDEPELNQSIVNALQSISKSDPSSSFN